MSDFPRDPDSFCITDVGSTTTKAVLFERRAGKWQFTRAEAGTTVEKPHEDVAVGVRDALRRLERESGRTLLAGERPAVPFLSTSSAGGGLAMVVTGLVRDLTAKTADRVALGAGAIVLEVLAMNDDRTPYRKIEDLRRLRPDMVLLAGGFDGDALTNPVFIAEMLVEAGLHPKLNPAAKLPVVYAGNANAAELVGEVLGEGFLFRHEPNVMPDLDSENVEPAREAIHEVFMSHVMSQAPGYERLKSWVGAPIVPTPAAFGEILGLASRELGRSILAVDIGGATTDVFSVRDGRVLRTVSANLGMSYSILNTAETGGTDAMTRLHASELGRTELWNRIGNKMVHPTRLARTADDMRTEWALATIAIREAVRHHFALLNPEPEDPKRLGIDLTELLTGRKREKPDRVAVRDYDIIIGSGGILSHSPRPAAAMVLLDALQPEGTVELAVDSAFIFPHIGVLSRVEPGLALDLFRELGLVKLGTLHAGTGEAKVRDKAVKPGTVRVFPVGSGGEMELTVPGEEAGETAELRLPGGEVGVIVDRRERPYEQGTEVLVEGTDYVPPKRDGEELPVAAPVSAELTLRRELAIPGKVLVKTGDEVATDTVVARSERQFLRPFFLHVAEALEVEPGETAGCLTVGVGDSVETDDVVARRKKGLLGTNKRYRSPVSGRVERILPSGTLVVREKPEHARELTAVRVAKEIGKDPARLGPYLRVKPGDEVDRGQWLAADVSNGFRHCVSPVRGRVAKIDERFGIVLIEPLLEEKAVRAWLPGRVVSVSERGCEVVCRATSIEGVWGIGGEASGELVFGEPKKGSVLVAEHADHAVLERAKKAEVAGLVTAGLDLIDALEADPGFTVVAMAGFGMQGFHARTLAALEGHRGKLALVDGTTQLRVGVRRPRVILPG